MEILIIKLGAMGDVLRMTSILQPLKEKYPQSKITWVTKKNSMDLLAHNPFIDTVVLIGQAQQGALKGKMFDLVLSFDDEEEACGLASDVSSKKIIGAYLKDGKRLYTDDSSPWFDMGLISKHGKAEADKLKAKNTRTYQDIHFSMIGISHPERYPPLLTLTAGDVLFGEKFAKRNGISSKDKVIGINSGAGGRWQDKKLSIEQTAALIERIAKKSDAKIILFGGSDEEERNNEILKKAHASVIDAGCRNSVREFASLVNLCDVLISSDSLAMHVGIALGKKVVCFFYPTSASEITLYTKGKKIIGEGKSYCSYQAVCTHPPKWDIDEIANAAISLV